jgi:hypothetical protein
VEEALRRTPVPPRLEQDVDRVAVLVNCAPEIMPLTPDRHEELVQVPRVAQAAPSPGEPASVD